jgi:hypothetical protein
MTAKCSKCGRLFQSLLIPKEAAAAELSKQVLDHAHLQHLDVMQEIASLLKTLTFVVTINELTVERSEDLEELIRSALPVSDVKPMGHD